MNDSEEREEFVEGLLSLNASLLDLNKKYGDFSERVLSQRNHLLMVIDDIVDRHTEINVFEYMKIIQELKLAAETVRKEDA